MAIYRGPYYSASGCTGTKSGVLAATSWYLGAYGSRGAANLGTYVCKRLGSGWSIHADGRAADWGTTPYGVPAGWGWDLANALRLHSDELGVQLIIFQDRLWSASRPDDGWRNYSGDWHGHLHVEFTPTAAQSLTAARVQQILGSSGSGGHGGMIGLKHGDQGPEVRELQCELAELGLIPTDDIDGIYGDQTAGAVVEARLSVGSQNPGNGRAIGNWEYRQIKRAVRRAEAGKDGKDGPEGNKGDPGPPPTPQQIGTAVEAWMGEHGEQLRGPEGPQGEPGEVPREIVLKGLVLETAQPDGS